MRFVSSWRRRIPTIAATILAVGGSALALFYSPQVQTNNTTPSTEKNLASSQNIEQQLMDQIRQTQKAVQSALVARTLAVSQYANATGGATLLVQKKTLVPPKTQAKSGASGGKSGSEFGND